MAKKSIKSKETVIISQEDKIKKNKEARIAKANSEPKNIDSDQLQQEFRKFFIKLKAKLNIGKHMESILWRHFQARGFNSPEKFEDGVRDFGYKI